MRYFEQAYLIHDTRFSYITLHKQDIHDNGV